MVPHVGRAAAIAVLALAASGSASGLVQGPWSDRSRPAMERARELLAEMTLEEKLSMLRGTQNGAHEYDYSQACAYVGNIAAVPRLGIPPTNMNDGPQGFRDNGNPGSTTAFPSGLAMAASWDEQAVYRWGAGMGTEFYQKGSNVQLGPGLNVARVPLNGRNFEYISGEDPWLGYALAKSAVQGIQSQKVVANAKHWVNNNQETFRQTVSEEVDEATRWEMYYPPFEGAIEGGVGSFMCSYNKINGLWSCENPTTLQHDLKEALGFQGYVMSDWGATHSTSIMAGLDNQQPDDKFTSEHVLKEALAAGSLTLEKVNDSVKRILWSMFYVGVMDEPLSAWDCNKLKRNVSTEASLILVRELSANSTVLLKNDGPLLPLPLGLRLAVIGLADERAITHGGGSGSVVASYVVTPLEGIRAAAGAGAHVDFCDGTDVPAAVALARAADAVLVFVGTTSRENYDRTSLSMDGNGDRLVAALAEAAGQKVVVVASVPGAILMPWSRDVAAILTNFMPGQQAGNAIADVLFGKVSPSGKLPLTFPNVENETRLTPAQFPGVESDGQVHARYSEQLLIGYRYYDAHRISFTTGFPFGHGLSYTTFEYSGLDIDVTEHGAEVEFDVKNAGTTASAEVVQLYLTFPLAAGQPPMQLRGFRKTRVLAPGESQHVAMQVLPRWMSTWDLRSHRFEKVSGHYAFHVGSSSRDIRLSQGHDVPAEGGQLVV